MANPIKLARCSLLAALISLISLASLVCSKGAQESNSTSENYGANSNSTRQDGIDLAESLLRPQLAVQIYAAPTQAGGNQTIGHSNYTNHRVQSPKTTRIIVKKRRDEEAKASRGQAESHRDYQTASSKPMGTWQNEPNDEQQEPSTQSVDLHQLDGNTFTLAGPMINAIITVPGLNGSPEVVDQRTSASSALSDVSDEQLTREREDQLARNISAASVERAISHLLDTQATGNLEFNMNMNGDEIIINPISRRANSLLSTSLPAIIENHDNHQLLDNGETMMRQHSHNSLVDSDNSAHIEQAPNKAQVRKRFARLIKGDQERDRRWRPSRRQSSASSLADEKLPVSSENVETNADDSSGNSDYSSDDDDDEPNHTTPTKRNYDQDSDLGNESSQPRSKSVQTTRKFKTASGKLLGNSAPDKSENADSTLSGSAQDDEAVSSTHTSDRPAKAHATSSEGRRTSLISAGPILRAQSRKRRTHHDARRGVSNDSLQSSAERTSSIYTGNQKASRQAQANAAAKNDDNQTPSLVIKGDDLRRFEQLLEGLRSLSLVNLGGAKAKSRSLKSNQFDESTNDIDDSTKPAAAQQHRRHRDPSPTKLSVREQKPSSESSFEDENCSRSARGRYQQLAEDRNQDDSPDSSSSNHIEREDEQSQPPVHKDSSSDRYEENKQVTSHNADDSNDDGSSVEQNNRDTSESSKNDDDVNLDESDSNVSQRKASIARQPETEERGKANALYVRKTILQSYYDSHQAGANRQSTSDHANQPRQEYSDGPQEGFDDKAEDTSRNQEEAKQQFNSQSPSRVDDSRDKQQKAAGKDTNPYIDYNRLDDREVYRGSESQNFRFSAPVMQNDQHIMTKQSTDRSGSNKIPYALATTNEDQSELSSNN